MSIALEIRTKSAIKLYIKNLHISQFSKLVSKYVVNDCSSTFLSNTWNLNHTRRRYSDFSLSVYISSFSRSCVLNLPRKRIAAQSFSCFSVSSGKIAIFNCNKLFSKQFVWLLVIWMEGSHEKKSVTEFVFHRVCDLTKRRVLF